jgi:hypothetical protein
MFHLNSGLVEVYNVYTSESHCGAVAESIKHTVRGSVSCLGIPI